MPKKSTTQSDPVSAQPTAGPTAHEFQELLRVGKHLSDRQARLEDGAKEMASTIALDYSEIMRRLQKLEAPAEDDRICSRCGADGVGDCGMPWGECPLKDWGGLQIMPGDMLVSLNLWLHVGYAPARGAQLRTSIPGVESLGSAILIEGERRGWPEGWWEDPSVIPGLEGGKS